MNHETITLPRSVVEQALAALFMYKPMVTGVTFQHGLDAMQELRAALGQPPVEQEPVAYFYTRSGRVVSTEATDALMQQMIGESGRVALYAHPQPPRQPLTNEEIFDAIRPLCNNDTNCHAIIGLSIDEYRAIERAHGIGGEA